MNESLTDEFDWISARAACSVYQVFQKLRLQVESDVKKRNEIRTENEKTKYIYRFAADGGAFSVCLEFLAFEEQERGVVFKRTLSAIDVCSVSEELLFQGDVTLSNDGQCRIKVNDSEYNLWQFRKLALEGVLFKDVAKWRR